MNAQDAEKFQPVIEALKDIRVPMCSTPNGIMLSENLQGWIEQLVGRIEREIDN